MNLEIKEDNSSYAFTFNKYANDTASTISTATIAIESNAGTEILAATTMDTISGGSASHTIDFSADTDYVIARNYKAVMVIDSVTHIRLFDIVKYPFQNEVNIETLRDENRQALDEIAGSTAEGTADSGSTTTLVDATLSGQDTYLGGVIKIYPAVATDITTEHTITIDDGAGALTFTPARGVTVGTQQYSIRRSFQEDIDRAGDIVQADLFKLDKRAYLILDNTQVSNMIVYKFFERMFALKRRAVSDDDTNHINKIYYQELYDGELTGLPLRYDANADNNISAGEESMKDSIRILR